jgi:hypothetical protein
MIQMRFDLHSLLGLVLLTSCALSPSAPAAPAPAAPAQVAPAQVAPAQDRPSGPVPETPGPEFVTLNNAWKGAFYDYSVALLRFDRANAGKPPEKRDPKGPPLHPAGAWWQRFDELGRKGDPDALAWQVDQAANAFAEPAAKANAAEQALLALLAASPGHRLVEDALEDLRPLFPAFGRERFLALLTRVHEQAQGPENQARALATKAWAITRGESDTTAEHQREVRTIQEEILLGYPGTRAAKQVAEVVYQAAEREFLKAELVWIDAVRALQLQGKEPKDWPPQPMHAWNQTCMPIAIAGGFQAKELVKNAYPRYLQAEGNGIGYGLVWLQSWWTLTSGALPSELIRQRLGMVDLVARQFHGQPLATTVMVDIASDAQTMPLELLEPAIAPILADDSAPKAQALALYARGLARTGRNQSADWQGAREDIELLLQKFPTEEIAARAQALLSSMLQVWPGAPAPDFRGVDQDGLAFKLTEYQGFVTVIDFCSTTGGLAAEDIARRSETVRSLEGRPFRWIGAVCDAHTRRSFSEFLGKTGIKWRCALLQSRQSDMAALWSVQFVPVVFVVDAKGVIRGRNLPWAEQQALIEKLVAEAEKR